MENRQAPTGLKTVALRTVARSARWLILLLALYAVAQSLPRLEVWPDGWKIPVSGFIQNRLGVADEAVVCIALASLVLSYWGVREGKKSAADLARMAGFLSGLPWAATLMDWVAKGVVIMFKTIRQRAMDMIREEARAEGLEQGREQGLEQGLEEGLEQGLERGRAEEAAKWRAWWERRTAANPDFLDENDPPPAPPNGNIRN